MEQPVVTADATSQISSGELALSRMMVPLRWIAFTVVADVAVGPLPLCWCWCGTCAVADVGVPPVDERISPDLADGFGEWLAPGAGIAPPTAFDFAFAVAPTSRL